MRQDDPPPKPKPVDRDAKLAQALRANLRRRKAPPAASGPGNGRRDEEASD